MNIGEQSRGLASRIGTGLCLAIAAYAFVSVGYALVKFPLYGAGVPQFLRYIALPAFVGLLFLTFGLGFKRRFALLAGLYGSSVMVALFIMETMLTVRQVPVFMGMIGKLSAKDQEILARREDLVRGFTLGSMNRRLGTARLKEAVLSGFPGSAVVLCAPEGNAILYKADRYGFNNPDNIYDSPVDLMLLGDSFAEGFCLPQGKDIAGQIRTHGINAMSAGFRGSGPLMELAVLGRFGPELKPRYVVIAFFEGNDWKNLGEELKVPWLKTALSADADFGKVKWSPKDRNSARSVIMSLSQRPVSIGDLFSSRKMVRNFFALQMTSSLLGLTYPKVAREIPEFRKILQRAKSITSSWGGRLRLLYIPRISRYSGVFPSAFAYEKLHKMVIEAANAEDIRVIDMTAALNKRHNPLDYYAKDGHFNERGAELVAGLVAKEIEESTSIGE